ncbi:MAG: hypothetical protein E6J20_16290 [Chloroflexi bacterium]|nr:MAG: hypothetical protein E6J20_16290 [Chloroflexota bacterium]
MPDLRLGTGGGAQRAWLARAGQPCGLGHRRPFPPGRRTGPGRPHRRQRHRAPSHRPRQHRHALVTRRRERSAAPLMAQEPTEVVTSR